MARGFSVTVGADARAFESSVRNGVVKPLEEAARSLDGLADAGEDAGRDASRGVDKVTDSLDDVKRAARDTGRDAERDLGRIGDGLHDAEDAARDLGGTADRELSDLERSADSAGDAVSRLGSDGARDADRLADGLSDAGTAASDLGSDGARDVGRLEKALKDAQIQSGKTDKAMDDVGTNGRAGFDKAREGASELTNEMGSNLGEAVSSFRGDMTDLGQIGQDTLGGLAATVAGTGPAGLIGALALAAGAAGFGLILGAQENARVNQEELNAAAAAWADAYASSGGKIVSASSVVAEAQAIATDPERYQVAKDNARDWGVTVSNALLTMAGDQTALETTTRRVAERQKEWGEIVRDTSTGSANSWDKSNMTGKQREFGNEVYRGIESLKLQKDAMEIGANAAYQTSRALFDYTEQVGESTGETDDLGRAIKRLPDGKEIAVDAKTRQAFDEFRKVERKDLKDKSMDVKVRVDDSAARNYQPRDKTARLIYKVSTTGLERYPRL